MASSDHVIDFAEMIGGEFDFYGCADQRFNLDGLTYEVIEDNRSLLGSCFDRVEVCEESSAGFDLPIARVVVEEDCGTYELTDLHDGHCWLRFGTEYCFNDNAGQYFVFEYTPREPGD